MGKQFVEVEMADIIERFSPNDPMKFTNNGSLFDCVINTAISDCLFSNVYSAAEQGFSFGKRKIGISKMFSFAAAHFLPNHKGKCKYLHGHEWKLEVEVYLPVNAEGMVMDYYDLKKIVNESVIDVFDHSFLNTMIVNPTAENLLVYIWNLLQYDGRLKGIKKLTLWESDGSKAVLKEKQMDEIVRSQA